MSVLNQLSLLQALMLGGMDGLSPVSEVKKLGDFGIGTFDGSEGECIFLDGKLYKAKSDGDVVIAGDDEKMPFGMFTFFEKSFETVLPEIGSLEELSEALNKTVDEKGRNYIYALRIHAKYPYMKVRSLGKQKKPYPRLKDALKDQKIYEYTEIDGTVIAYYCPDYMEGLNMFGWHYHFISDDRRFGGHILDLKIAEGAAAEIDVIDEYNVKIPVTGAFQKMELAQDLKKDIEAAEK